MSNSLNLNANCAFPLQKGVYYIDDDHINNIPLFLNKNDSWNLCIINRRAEVKFYQNDECIMKNNEKGNLRKDGKQVDWICFDEKDFYFIEAKNVKKKATIDKKDVEHKFINTLNFYQSNFNISKSTVIHWVLSIRSPSKTTNSGDNTKKARYLQDYQVKYNEINTICFKP